MPRFAPLVLAALFASLSCATFAAAAVETHAVDYTYDLQVNGDAYPKLTFPGFDDQNGTRTLTRVDLRVQADVSATLSIENMNTTPLASWSLEGQHLILTGMERPDSKMPGPFAFLGGLGFEPFTAPLAANDGTAGSGTDYFEKTDHTLIDSLMDMDPSYLSFFRGSGDIVAIIGPFTEFFLGDASQYDPTMETGDAVVEFKSLAQTGTLTLSYEYTLVPEPASLSLLGGVLMLRRRR